MMPRVKRGRLFNRETSFHVRWHHIVPVSLRLMVENFPRWHGDPANGTRAFGVPMCRLLHALLGPGLASRGDSLSESGAASEQSRIYRVWSPANATNITSTVNVPGWSSQSA